VAELLQQMIRNACVNDAPRFGARAAKRRSAQDRPRGTGPISRWHEATARASSLVAGSKDGLGCARRSACSVTQMCSGQRRRLASRPFDGPSSSTARVWGSRCRGHAPTSPPSMAVAFRHLADDGSDPKGTFCSSASPTRSTRHPRGRMAHDHVPDQVRADYLITEAGGFPWESPDGVRLSGQSPGEGRLLVRLTVRGRRDTRHKPLRTDNASSKQPRSFVVWPDTSRWPISTTPGAASSRESAFPRHHRAAAPIRRHRCVSAGIPRPSGWRAKPTLYPHHDGSDSHDGRHQGERDPRPSPSRGDIRDPSRMGPAEVDAMLNDALGDLAVMWRSPGTSPVRPVPRPPTLPLWNSLERVARRSYPDARCVPFLTVGAHRCRFFRKLGHRRLRVSGSSASD